MVQEHPHADATYRLVQLDGGSWAAEVSIPGSAPTMVSGFSTAAAADAWISAHKAHVATGLRRRPLFRDKVRR
jgi:hypothetical protein